jgi:RNA-directed DNA polymerase
VVETDIADCFEAIPHDRLMSAIEERIVDRQILKLLRAMLRAGVMQDQAVTRSDAGTPQGGVISPLLCNVYLHRLDRQWTDRGAGVLVRYADDMVVMCQTRQEAERALVALRVILSELGLTLKDAKTRIVELREGGEGLDFLGFHHRWVRGNTPNSKHLCFLARWPSRQAMAHARQRIRELTDRRRLRVPVEVVVQDVNRFLRGWAGYFRYGNSAQFFDKVTFHALVRVGGFITKRHSQHGGYGWWVINQSPDRMGLINLNGTIVAPRPNRPWRRDTERRW